MGVKRILTFDFIRGLSIFLMVIVHTWLNIFDLSLIKNIALEDLNPLLLIIGGLLFVMGHSRTLFLLISAIIYSYTIYRAILKRTDFRPIAYKNLTIGFLLYLIGNLREGIFNPWGVLNGLYETGQFNPELLRFFYLFETLQMIGVGIITLTLVFSLILYFRQQEKRTILTFLFLFLAVIFIFTAPIVHIAIDNYFGVNFEFKGRHTTGNFFHYLCLFFWVALAGQAEPIFPFLGTIFIGAIVGMNLGIEHPSKHFPKFMALGGFSSIILGLLHLIIIDDMVFTMWFEIHPTWYFLVNIGIHLILISFFLHRFEFRKKTNLDLFAKRTVFLRRWGAISLTIYFWQIIDIIPRELVSLLFNVNLRQKHQEGYMWTFIMIIVVCLFWNTIIYYWEKIGFVGSWEWILAFFVKKLFGKNNHVISRSQFNAILYSIEPIKFVSSSSTLTITEQNHVPPKELA